MRCARRQDLVGVVAAEGLNAAGDVDTHAVLAGAVLESGDAGNGLSGTGVFLLCLRLNLLSRQDNVGGLVVPHVAAPPELRATVRGLDLGERHRQLRALLQLRLDGLGVEAVVELGVGGDGRCGGRCRSTGVEGLHEGGRHTADGVAQALYTRLLEFCAARQVGRLLASLLGSDVGVMLEPLLALQRGELLLQRASRRERSQREGEGRRRAG